MTKNLLRWGAGFLAMGLVSCKMGPDYQRPVVDVPATVRGSEAGDMSMGDASWREVFGDGVLRGLIEEALVSNRDLVQATYRIEEARAYAAIANSEFFPTLDARASATRSRASQAAGQVPPDQGPYGNSFNVTALLIV